MIRRISSLLLILLAAFLALQAGFSLQWPIAHDEAPLFYEGYLMQAEGRVPYRDLFDFQMPGSFTAYHWIGRLAGFDAFRIRVIDLLLLAALAAVIHSMIKPFGRAAAAAAWILFGLAYLRGGPSMSLQREYLMLLFVAPAAWIALRGRLSEGRRVAVGLLFGLAAAIKPHAPLGLIPILTSDILDLVRNQQVGFFRALAKSVLPAAIGFAFPLLLLAGWLESVGALSRFLGIAANYWPLYAQINGQMEVRAGTARLAFILDQLWRLGGYGLWLVPAGFGAAMVPARLRGRFVLLAGLALSYALYPALSGQFFPYHSIPFAFFVLMLASTSLAEAESRWRTTALAALLLAAAWGVRPSPAFLRQVDGRPVVTSSDRAAGIAHFLALHLEPGDAVQPLDWTGGALLAMLETRSSLATPYVFDFYFYHHVSDPYVRSLRADFLRELREASPRYVIEVTAIDKPWVSGEDTTREFPELRAYLEQEYRLAVLEDDYLIHVRK